jgi:hypothetical protein
MKQRQQKVYHVELADPRGNEPKHSYFGSQAAIFQTFGNERLGISYRSLSNSYNLQEREYSNRHCTIRMGYLQVSRKNRNFAPTIKAI